MRRRRGRLGAEFLKGEPLRSTNIGETLCCPLSPAVRRAQPNSAGIRQGAYLHNHRPHSGACVWKSLRVCYLTRSPCILLFPDTAKTGPLSAHQPSSRANRFAYRGLTSSTNTHLLILPGSSPIRALLWSPIKILSPSLPPQKAGHSHFHRSLPTGLGGI